MSQAKELVRRLVDDERKFQLICSYYELLTKYNAGVNIISFNSVDEVWDNIMEAVCLAGYIKDSKKIMDIGSGNGLPGVIVAIMLEKSDVFLVEIKKKKCMILEHLKYKLDLKNLIVVNKPVEAILDSISVDTYISKAFSSLKSYYEILKDFIGYAKIISLKGSSLMSEKQALGDVNITEIKIDSDNFILKKNSYIVEFKNR